LHLDVETVLDSFQITTAVDGHADDAQPARSTAANDGTISYRPARAGGSSVR